MHGRKKVPIDEAKKIQLAQKTKKLAQLCNSSHEALNDPEQYEAFINGTLPILDYLDDFATLWNKRKEEFLKKEPTLENLQKELQLTERILYRNNKSYFAFHHRRWCIELVPEYDCSAEVIQCDKLLSLDERNIHAWRHKR